MSRSAVEEIAALGSELNANQYKIVHLAASYDAGLEWFDEGMVVVRAVLPPDVGKQVAGAIDAVVQQVAATPAEPTAEATDASADAPQESTIDVTQPLVRNGWFSRPIIMSASIANPQICSNSTTIRPMN